MSERIRIFRGANELSYSDCTITKTDDTIVDQFFIAYGANSNVSIGSVIDFKDNAATTTFFSGKIQDIKTPNVWESKGYTNGFELINTPIQQVYTDKTPEYIVQDIIDNYTQNLTYASSTPSGYTINGDYIADGYLVDIIRDMIILLNWKLRIDSNDNVYFEPPAEINNGVTLTNGDNFSLTYFEDDQKEMINSVKIKAGFRNVFTTGETLSGSGTTWTFANKPTATARIVVSGSEVDPSTYKITSDTKTIVFDSTPGATPSADYSYDEPIVVTYQDDASANLYGEKFKKVEAGYITSFEDARRYAKNIVEKQGLPQIKAKGFQTFLNFDIDVNETVTVVDNVRNRTEQLVISKIEYDAVQGTTSYELGTRDYQFYDWQSGIQERIKNLERIASNESTVTFARSTKDYANITLTRQLKVYTSSPNDSFILGHPTLSRLRSGLNFEADCSDSGNHGTWSGSNIDGSQFSYQNDSTLGWRLSNAVFDTNKISCSNTINNVQEVWFALKDESVSGNLVELTSSARIYLSSSTVTTTGLTNANISSQVDGDWTLYRITFDSINADAIEVGDGYTGLMDELFFFSNSMIAADFTMYINQDWYDTTNAFTFSNNPTLYYSFDNPRLGDRESSKTLIETVTN